MNKFKPGNWIRRGTESPIKVLYAEPDWHGRIVAHNENTESHYLVTENQYELFGPAVDEVNGSQAAIVNLRLSRLEKRVDNLTAAVDRLQRWRGNVRDA